MNAMAVIKPVSIKLQYRASDIVNAYSKVKDVIDELGDIRKDDKIIHSWYVQSEAVAAEVSLLGLKRGILMLFIDHLARL